MSRRRGRIDGARLNHILIPQTSAGRERFRKSRLGRWTRPFGAVWFSLTDEGRLVAILAVLSGAFGLDVRNTAVYLIFCLLSALLLSQLIVARFSPLRAAELQLQYPKRVTVGEPMRFALTCVYDPTLVRMPLRLRGPFLPWDGAWSAPLPPELPPSGSGRTTATMVATFRARGSHHLDAFEAVPVVPLGLATGTGQASETPRFFVVPRVANVRHIEVPMSSKHQPGGVALASKSGESMDLLGVRPYRPGDPVRDLHARSSARAGVPVVREYVQEYFTRVGVVLGIDAPDDESLEAGIELAAGIVAFFSRGEALIDVLIVGEQVHDLTLGRSLGFLDQALDMLASVQAGPTLPAEALAARLGPYLERLSTLVVVSQHAPGADSAALEAAVLAQGVSCRTIHLDASTQARVRAGEALSL